MSKYGTIVLRVVEKLLQTNTFYSYSKINYLRMLEESENYGR